jgi:glucose/mannose transport system permease protein
MTAEVASARAVADNEGRRVAKRPTWITHNISAKIASIPMVFTALVVFVGGSVWSMVYSFTSSKLLPVTNWVGLAQYERLFTTARWYTAMQNVVIYGVMSMTLSLIIGFLLAALIDQKVRFENTFRTIYLYPFAMSFIVTGLVWQWILNPLNGIEKVAHDLGLHWFQFDWLTRTDTAIYTIVIAALWQGSGLTMALMLAGMRGIDQEIWKAAKIDGIPTWRTYLFIVIPMMRPVFVTTIVLNATGIVRVYDLVVAQTNGGPGTATDVPARYVIDMMFHNGNLGQALAASTIMLITVLVILVPWSIREYGARTKGGM